MLVGLEHKPVLLLFNFSMLLFIQLPISAIQKSSFSSLYSSALQTRERHWFSHWLVNYDCYQWDKSCCALLRSQVGTECRSQDLFRYFMVISLSPSAEAGRRFWSIAPMNASQFMAMLFASSWRNENLRYFICWLLFFFYIVVEKVTELQSN